MVKLKFVYQKTPKMTYNWIFFNNFHPFYPFFFNPHPSFLIKCFIEQKIEFGISKNPKTIYYSFFYNNFNFYPPLLFTTTRFLLKCHIDGKIEFCIAKNPLNYMGITRLFTTIFKIYPLSFYPYSIFLCKRCYSIICIIKFCILKNP